jgi:hypothetical protein
VDGEFPLPPIVIDENMPASFVEFFADRGYTVIRVGSSLPAGSPDVSVAAAALAEGAIVVTLDSHFRNLKTAPEGIRGRLQKADRIYFRGCTHVQALARVKEPIGTIESEYRLAKAQNRKFYFQINAETFTVRR